MTLVISKGITLRNQLPADTEADAYIAAVEAADGQSLETATKVAIHSFVKGCKADGIWPALKASCILAGARTLTGALVPLVGTAPTNVSFVSGDYNRKTGLVGNGSSKYINSNYIVPNTNLDNHHLAINISTLSTGWFMGAITAAGANFLQIFNTTGVISPSGAIGLTSFTNATTSGPAIAAGFAGISRANSSQVNARSSATTQTISNSRTSTGFNLNQFVFARNDNSAPGQHTASRFNFYSIGESLDLALLDARVTDLINAFAAAIP